MQSMQQIDAINQAVAYVEAHLADEMDMERLARIAGCASGSFSRLFSLLAGMPLNDYVRKRRLTRAGYEIRDTDHRIIDVALHYGYDSADAFTRAFAKQHGVTPTQVRRCGAPLRAFQPISFHITVKGAENMEFRVEDKREKTLYGVWTDMEGGAGDRFEKEHELWAAECENLPGLLSDEITGTWYGVWQSGRYAVAREGNAVYKSAQRGCIPAGRYAVFVSEKGGFAGEVLPRMRSAIFEKCLKDAGLQLREEVEIEVYHLFPHGEKHRRFYEYWVPVE